MVRTLQKYHYKIWVNLNIYYKCGYMPKMVSEKKKTTKKKVVVVTGKKGARVRNRGDRLYCYLIPFSKI